MFLLFMFTFSDESSALRESFLLQNPGFIIISQGTSRLRMHITDDDDMK